MSPVKKITPAKCVAAAAIAFLVPAIAFVAQTCWLFAFGRVAASASVELDSVSHRVVLRERCISDPINGTLDRFWPAGRVAEYEYWTELRRGRRLVVDSERESWDSVTYDHPRIDSADANGVTVSLDPRPPYPSIHRFAFRPTPK